MRIGIDASNVCSGGGIIHLQKILEQAEPKKYLINRVVVWGGDTPLDNLPEKPWLELRKIPNLNLKTSQRLFWQQTKLGKLAHEDCDLLFVPGGLYLGGFSPFVTMFQNMQIFESKERLREGFSKEWLRLSLLKWAQSRTFREASGLICLSEYSHNSLTQHHSFVIDQTPVQLIPHGTEKVKNEHIISDIKRNPINGTIRLLYVSTVKKYKHQWNLIDAVGLLRKEGISVELHLVGGGDSQALEIMQDSIHRNKSPKKFIKVLQRYELNKNGKSISIEPCENDLIIDFEIVYNNQFIGTQRKSINVHGDNLDPIYNSRTFCLFEDIEKLKKMNLAKGGSLENAVVVKGN